MILAFQTGDIMIKYKYIFYGKGVNHTMDKCRKYIRIVSNLLLLLAIIFFSLALFGTNTDNEAPTGDFSTQSFNENWSVAGDVTLENITLPFMYDNDQSITVMLKNTLPAELSDGMRLSMRTALQDARFYIDGELRSEYVSDNFPLINDRLPSAYMVIDLTEADAGKPIEIKLSMKGQLKLNEIKIGYGNNLWFELLSRNISVVVAAIVLICGGFLATLSFFVLKRFIHPGKSVLYLGEAAIVIGLWILSESHIRQLLFNKPSYSAIFAYVLCELIGGFIVLYFNEVQQHKYNTLYVSMEILIFGQALLNIILNFTGIAVFYDTLFFSHIWLIVSAGIFFVTIILDIRSKHIRKYSITAWGMLLFTFFCALEMISFYLQDFFVLGKYICLGLLVLLLATILQTVHDEMRKIRLNADLEQEREAAINANRAKTEFLAKMSHDIRTPVNTVLGMTEMILRESGEEHITDYANDVKVASTTLLNLVNDILDTSKIEAGKMELVPVNYSLRIMLHDLYNMFLVRTREKQLTLNFHIAPDIPSEYYGDDNHIRQILMNLLSNAVKYTNQGSVTLSVTCCAEGETALLCFSVEDTGIGIRQEDIETLYTKFGRLDIEKNRNIEGFGLGMYIVQQLLKMMDSQIQIQSEYGKGSVFSFTLRQKITGSAPLGDFHDVSKPSRKKAQPSYLIPNARVLVVDDNPMNLKVFRSLLKHTQIQITEASGGNECLELLCRERFDLVFLDYMMPEMDGIETFHVIKKEKLCEGTPIVMLSASALISQKMHFLEEGFDDFLSKPIIPEQLDELILKYLSPLGTETSEKVSVSTNDTDKNASADDNDILDQKQGLMLCCGDKTIYHEILKAFVQNDFSSILNGYYSAQDWNNYRIAIHGTKSGAKSIGAKRLATLALSMETALSERNDIAYIRQQHSVALAELETLENLIQSIIAK